MVRREAEDGPIWLSRAAARVALDEAIRQAQERGLGTALERVVGLDGYRRQLAGRFRLWTLAERPARLKSPRATPVDLAEAAIFEVYESILEQLGARDEAGMTVWASKRLARSPRFWAPSGGSGPIIFLDFDNPPPAHQRILERALRSSRAVHVAVTHTSDPDLAEIDHATSAVRARLLHLGLVETALEPPSGRPEGLCQAERLVFGTRSGESGGIASPAGLAIRGAPQGEGAARIVAHEVRKLMAQGAALDEILIIYRQWNDEAELALETLRAWEIPAHADVARSLRGVPAIAALRLGVSIPLHDWETELIIGLLRHGQFQPDWPAADRLSLARAASLIRATGVFRGAGQLLAGFDRFLAEPDQADADQRTVQAARAIADRLIKVLGSLDRPRPWSEQVLELARVARELGIALDEGQSLEPLWDALDDQSEMLLKLKRSDELWSWADFVSEVDTIVGEIEIIPVVPCRSIRLTTLDQAEGARANHVILADLAEGSFPARAAVEPLLALGPLGEPDARSRFHLAQEMLRFLKVLGSANSGVILTYPATDLKGQELLRAGFLDDLLALMPKEILAECHVSLSRLDPTLIGQPELAGSAADIRILAAARASTSQDSGDLVRLARDPAHREILRGTAAALFVEERRMRGREFTEFEGLLGDAAAQRELERQFGPRSCYSPSQLETYIACPFQFFCKHVLKLEPAEQRDELEEDLTERGSRLHDILENFERLLQQPDQGPDPQQIPTILVDQVRNQEKSQPTEMELGLWEIERQRLIRTVRHYRTQRNAYEQEGGLNFRPYKLELAFGEEGAEHPSLEIGRGEQTIRLRGRIDRIDVAETPEGFRFRIIDYKSGKTPSLNEVKQGAMLQLPLYAMAVERLLFPDGGSALFDLGYWSLKKDGFKPISFPSWDQDQEALVAHVQALVDELRQGVFVVQSRAPDCESFCEFRNVCRIAQVRRTKKDRERSLPELSVPARRGRKASAAAKSAEAEDEP
jgi:RecB family exonuclease